MQELSSMMRAMELQRVIEDKVSEWRQRSARVAGKTVADSYQQPVTFKRQVNRRKNSAEINKIIAKYSKPNCNRNAGEKHNIIQRPPSPPPPIRPARVKKRATISKSVDNLTKIDVHSEPTNGSLVTKRYETKSHDDLTALGDVRVKSSRFQEHSIMARNEPNIKPNISIEDNNNIDYNDFKNIEKRKRRSIATSTPITERKPVNSNDNFKKCINYGASVSDLRKGVSEPDILSATGSRDSLNSAKTEYKKKWKILRQPFRKGTFDCLLLWKNRKSRKDQTR